MIVYLTGGIGTGKSTVLGMFGDLGARTLSADRIVHDLYERADINTAVAALLDLPLPLDKKAIADRIFADADARVSLEHFLHPLVQIESNREFASVGPREILVYEIPLPPEPRCGDEVCEVRAPLAHRLSRLAARGMSEQDALARIAAQPTEADYGKYARHIIVNDRDEDALRSAVHTVWEELQHGSRAV